MGKLSTAAVRHVINRGRKEELSQSEKIELLETRRAQIMPVMKYLGWVSLAEFPILSDFRGSFGAKEFFQIGKCPIKAPKEFDAKTKGLYYHHFTGIGRNPLLQNFHWLWGLTASRLWVKVKVTTHRDWQNREDVIDEVLVEVFDTEALVINYGFEDAWIDLSKEVDAWVEARRELLNKALEAQLEMRKQDAMVAPYMDTVGHGTRQDFVAARS